MKMKIIFGLMGFVSLLAASVANAATISLSPTSVNVANGDTFTLDVIGTGFDNLVTGGSINLQWDPTQLQLAMAPVDIANTMQPGFDVVASTFVLDNTTGVLDFTALLGFGFDPAIGPAFTWTSLIFQAVAPAGTSAAIIAQGAGGPWADNIGGDYAGGVIYEGATITVGAVPVPAAVWLFGSGLLGLVGVARRRQLAA